MKKAAESNCSQLKLKKYRHPDQCLFLNNLDRTVAWRSKKCDYYYIAMAALTVCTFHTWLCCFFFLFLLHQLNRKCVVNRTKLGRLWIPRCRLHSELWRENECSWMWKVHQCISHHLKKVSVCADWRLLTSRRVVFSILLRKNPYG